MTARPSRLGSVSYETESSWCEATDSWSTRLQVLGEPVLIQNPQQRIAEPITQQYAEEGKLGVRGPWGGSFTIELALTGQGGTGGTGATTDTDLYTLLVNFIGGGSSDCAGGTVSTTTSATEFTGTGTYESHNLLRFGTLGDGRGGGQFAAVDNISTTTLLTALPASLNVADVIYAPLHVYPNESTSMASITSTRWLLQTANGQWKIRGAFPQSISFSGMNPGEQPRVSLTYGFSYIAEANETFPDATEPDAKDGTICAAGPCFLQNVGTATRQTFSLRDWALNIDFQSTPLMGPDGIDAYQTIVGAVRTRVGASLSLTIDAEASGTNSFNDIYTGSSPQHCLITLSSAAGKAIGWYFKNCRPTSYVGQGTANGLNTRTLELECMTDATTTSEETMASWVLAMA